MKRIVSTKRQHIKDLGLLYYHELFAKLATFIQKEFGENPSLRILFAMSENDKGKGNAILKLIKQFGFYPDDNVSISGEIDCGNYKDFFKNPGLTLVIQAFPLIKNSAINSDSFLISDDEPQTCALVPMIDGLSDPFSRNAFEKLMVQVNLMTECITHNHCSGDGVVIYLSGFSYNDIALENSLYYESKYIPWHLSIYQSQKIPRVYAQPDLMKFLKALPLAPFKIDDLEKFISEIDDEEKFSDY